MRPVVGESGDALARMQCLAQEVQVSCDHPEALQLPSGEVSTKLPRTIRLPEGEYYGASETASGVNGWWIVSRGDVVPWRMKMRTASSTTLRHSERACPARASRTRPWPR